MIDVSPRVVRRPRLAAPRPASLGYAPGPTVTMRRYEIRADGMGRCLYGAEAKQVLMEQGELIA